MELVVSVSEDLNLVDIDLADLGDEPFATLGEVVTAYRRFSSAGTGAGTRGTD